MNVRLKLSLINAMLEITEINCQDEALCHSQEGKLAMNKALC